MKITHEAVVSLITICLTIFLITLVVQVQSCAVTKLKLEHGFKLETIAPIGE